MSSPLDTLYENLKDHLDQVNHVLIHHMKGRNPITEQLASYVIESGGKRIRPLITLASAALMGEPKRAVNLAACVEMIHTATLLHDDVIDESPVRRGKPSAYTLWGNKPSILVGDFLFSQAFILMIKEKSLAILDVLSHASSVISQGEIQQLQTINELDTSEETYLEIITAKTASLFSAACQVGAMTCTDEKDQYHALRDFGLFLGISFQIIDDVLDYSSQQKTLGKEIGHDFEEGKMTLPILLAYKQGTDQEKAFWKSCFKSEKNRMDKFPQALDYLNKYGTLDQSVERAKNYGKKACICLEKFDNHLIKLALVEMVELSMTRPY